MMFDSHDFYRNIFTKMDKCIVQLTFFLNFLFSQSLKYIQRNFMEVSNNQLFPSLSKNVMKEIILSPLTHQIVHNEINSLIGINRWLGENNEKPLHEVAALLDLVSYGHIQRNKKTCVAGLEAILPNFTNSQKAFVIFSNNNAF